MFSISVHLIAECVLNVRFLVHWHHCYQLIYPAHPKGIINPPFSYYLCQITISFHEIILNDRKFATNNIIHTGTNCNFIKCSAITNNKYRMLNRGIWDTFKSESIWWIQAWVYPNRNKWWELIWQWFVYVIQRWWSM